MDEKLNSAPRVEEKNQEFLSNFSRSEHNQIETNDKRNAGQSDFLDEEFNDKDSSQMEKGLFFQDPTDLQESNLSDEKGRKGSISKAEKYNPIT